MMGKVESIPRAMILIGDDDLAAIHAKLDAIAARMDQVHVEPLPDWVSVQRYAEIMGRSERTVRNWINAGQIESRRIGGVLQVRR